jgi:predicted aldo/keto reductase-like oxidoreductase
MLYRRFGRTELNMPVISSGGMRFQTSWERGDPVKSKSIANLETIMARAMDLGINHFETARGYGTSEQEFSHVLPQYKRSDLILQTKIIPSGDDVKAFLKDLDDSMKTLKVDYLDLLGVHGINNDEILKNCLKKGGILDTCLALKEKGVIRHLGFSTHGPTQTIIDAIETDLFDYVNMWYSYVYPFNWPAIQRARAHDMGVFIISPNDKGGMLYAPSDKLTRLCAPLKPMTFNDVFILNNVEIHTISCGVQVPQDYDVHVEAVSNLDTLKDTVTTIARRLDQEMAQIVDDKWPQTYLHGIPQWETLPGQMNVQGMVWLWSLLKAFDLEDYAKFRYNLLGVSKHWFPGQNAKDIEKISQDALRDALKESPYQDTVMKILMDIHDQLKAEEGQRLGA